MLDVGDDATTLTTGAVGSRRTLRPVVHVTVVWHPDQARIGDQVLLSGDALSLARTVGDLHAPGRGVTGPLADPFVSRTPIVFEALGDEVRVTPPRKVSVGGRPGQARLSAAELERGVPITIRDRIVLWVHRRVPRLGAVASHGLVGYSAALDEVRTSISRAARTPHPVLIRGESGVGKELVAQALHRVSERRGPYHPINMAAIATSTAAAALFGHAKGAFTGATEAKPGWFATSEGGTLFLDEIGEAAPELQALLLRVLESGEIQPVGAGRTRTVDVRVLAATDAELEAAIGAGQFKSPLLHRLSAIEIHVPPLRERPVDVGALLSHFLRLELQTHGMEDRLNASPNAPAWVPATLVERMLSHHWPGNVRELRNLARRIVLHGGTDPQLNPAPFLARMPTPRPALPATGELDVETVFVAMREQGWSTHRAAQVLGVPRTTLYRLLERDERIRKATEIDDGEFRAAFAETPDPAAISERLRLSLRSVKQRLRHLGLI